MTFDQGKELAARLEDIANGPGLAIIDPDHMRAAAAEIRRAHEFISEVAWRFSDYAASNWSGPDVIAHVADFFDVTVSDLEKLMEDVG